MYGKYICFCRKCDLAVKGNVKFWWETKTPDMAYVKLRILLLVLFPQTMSNSHPLCILHRNCNGIFNKLDELQTFAIKPSIYIILLGETKLNPNDKLKIISYHSYRFNNTACSRMPSYGSRLFSYTAD